MKDSIHKVCYILWIMIMVLFVVLFDFMQLNVTGNQTKGSYHEITEYEEQTVEDALAPTGIRKLYSFTLSGIEESHCELVFYCIHQNTRVYFEEECIYGMELRKTGISGNSPGYVWNSLSFSEEDNGKRITIEITPVYTSSNDIIPRMYFGNKYDIARSIIIDAFPDLFLSLVVIIIGLIYIFFVLYNNRNTSAEKELAMLGFFSIQLGIWKISESEAINFLAPGYPMLPQITFVALMFMGPTMVLYIKELYSTREKLIWKIPCVMGFANIIITLLLQYIGVADMRQMLPLTHVVIGITAFITVIMTIYEIYFVGLNPKLKRNILCLAIAFAGGGLDTLFYYVTRGTAPSIFAMCGLLIHILISGVSSMRDVKELMNFGIKAQKYEQLAYHDQLTGLYNRAAYEKYINSKEFRSENCIVLIMDLNNLKACNDVLGHEKGDIYIRTVSQMINEAFEDIGYCYRMGGDEFYVLITNATLKLCQQRVERLKEQVTSCTDIGDGFVMGIACGFEMYDSSRDNDISETARRADKAMYQDKFVMKKGDVR